MSGLLPSLIASALGLLAQTRLPRLDGEIKKLPGLNEQVEILRDGLGIPHIYAKSAGDLFYAQGFIHAQDRLWQMEFNRRLVAGRLSEILGKVTLPLDRWMRTLTMRRVAEYEVRLLDDETRCLLQAYADGINACMSRGPLPVEFALLRYRPEPWILADSLAWIKMMSWTLSVNWEMEILRARVIERLGSELTAELEPFHLERWPFVVPPDSDYSYIGDSALQRAKAARPFSGPSPYEGLGSNNWVLHGSRTSTGMPLLANDMHLMMGLPSIWYENHLVCDEFALYGVMFPGLPGIIAGHNGHVAWGFTNGFPDVQDLYMEHLRRIPEGKVEVEYQDHWEPARVLHEKIQVKGEGEVVEEVVITRHGPIINVMAPDFIGEQNLALRWTSLEPDTMFRGLPKMFRARDCLEFHQALRDWTAPIQNTVYADTGGNIAYTFPGKVPIRAKGDGSLPVPGWTDEYEWLGYVPFEQLPHLYNPPQGFIATANNRVISPDYPAPIILEPISGDRAERIVELIQSQDKLDIPYIKKMHFDLLSSSARAVSAALRSANLAEQSLAPRVKAALKHLQAWDGTLSPDGPAAALYQVLIRKLAALILRHKLGDEDLALRVMGKGPTPVLAEGSLFGARWLAWLTRILGGETPPQESDPAWFDLDNISGRAAVITQALIETVEELTSLLGPDMEAWGWGKLHTLSFKHVLSAGMEPLQRLFNRGPFPLGGDSNTVWATGSSSFDLNTEQVVGPPFRMIVDLGDLSNSLGLLSPGQSGNPTSPFYDNQIQDWFSAKYHRMLFERNQVEAGACFILKLSPG
ncbi:MAG: penicillin acylase family protein [Anaerolineales bacterium]|nr:penicillin acylase family protein [Anaerolineales bacterium]